MLLQDKDAVKGQWKLAQVKSVEPSRDGKVRDVKIRYKIQKPGKEYTGQEDVSVSRSVHRLVVLLPIEECS